LLLAILCKAHAKQKYTQKIFYQVREIIIKITVMSSELQYGKGYRKRQLHLSLTLLNWLRLYCGWQTSKSS